MERICQNARSKSIIVKKDTGFISYYKKEQRAKRKIAVRVLTKMAAAVKRELKASHYSIKVQFMESNHCSVRFTDKEKKLVGYLSLFMDSYNPKPFEVNRADVIAITKQARQMAEALNKPTRIENKL